MNITSKKSISIIIFLCYIISDLLFLKTADRDYANIILLFSSTILFVFEVLFWGMLFLSSDGRERKSSVELLFLGTLAGVGLSRIFLISSPYINDLLNANIVLAYIIGTKSLDTLDLQIPLETILYMEGFSHFSN